MGSSGCILKPNDFQYGPDPSHDNPIFTLPLSLSPVVYNTCNLQGQALQFATKQLIAKLFDLRGIVLDTALLGLQMEALVVDGLDADIGSSVTVHNLAVPDVDIQWITRKIKSLAKVYVMVPSDYHLHPSQDVAHHGNGHGDVSISAVDDGTSHRGKDHATRDCSDKQGATELGVATKTTQAQCKDGGKASGLEAQNQNEHSDRCSAGGVHRSHNEDEAESEVAAQDVTRLEGGDSHQTSGQETVEGIQALSNSEKIRALSLGATCFHAEIDEVVLC